MNKRVLIAMIGLTYTISFSAYSEPVRSYSYYQGNNIQRQNTLSTCKGNAGGANNVNCKNAAQAEQALKFRNQMLNYNPKTQSNNNATKK